MRVLLNLKMSTRAIVLETSSLKKFSQEEQNEKERNDESRTDDDETLLLTTIIATMKCQSTLLLSALAVFSSTIVCASQITNNIEDIDVDTLDQLNTIFETTTPTEYVAQSSPDIILALK